MQLHPNGMLPPDPSLPPNDTYLFELGSIEAEVLSTEDLNTLDCLADCALQRGEAPRLLTDPYKKFWDIASLLGDYEDELMDNILDALQDLPTKFADAESLRPIISPQRMVLITNLLEWVCLFSVGYLPDHYKSHEVKKFLGIQEYIDILSLSVMPHQGLGQLSFADLLQFVNNPKKFGDDDADRGISWEIIQCIGEEFQKFANEKRIVEDIEAYSHLQPRKYVAEIRNVLREMPLRSQLLWGLFVSVTCYHMNENERMSARPNEWPSTVPVELRALLLQLDQSLRTKPYQGTRLPSTDLSMTSLPLVPPPPKIKALTHAIPELPHWISNGDNSCYMSSTLWALIFLARKSVHDRTQSLLWLGDLSLTRPLRDARTTFINLFNDLIKDDRKLTFQNIKVNEFRSAMQKVFPRRFHAPDAKGQEDAFEFLTAVMTDLLYLDSCSAAAPKFLKHYRFHRTNDLPLQMPETYDYAEALKPVSRAEPLPLFDIRLEAKGESFHSVKSLVTQARSAGMEERHAYLPQKDGGEFRAVEVELTEQLMVESRESAPDYFIGRVARFRFDHVQGIRSKLFDPILANATLEFGVLGGSGETVCYDLAAITVHSGPTLEAGHYFTYLMLEHDGEWKYVKYDDLVGCEECEPEIMVADAMSNGYIYFYTKREEGKIAPPPLPEEIDFEESKKIKEPPQGQEERVKLPKRPRPEEEEAMGLPAEEEAMDLEAKIESSLVDVPAPSSRNCQEAKEWMAFHNLIAQYNLDERGYPSLEELLLVLFKYEVDPEEQAKRAHRKERELLLAASQVLKRPIYLIEPSGDTEIQVIESAVIIPGENYSHGEHFSNPPIYLYKQADKSCFLMTMREQ